VRSITARIVEAVEAEERVGVEVVEVGGGVENLVAGEEMEGEVADKGAAAEEEEEAEGRSAVEDGIECSGIVGSEEEAVGGGAEAEAEADAACRSCSAVC
jgi:hypothetical protein